MIRSILKGFSFGLTSGIITTLGLIVGLDSGTHSKVVVLGGILTIAVADAFSDALGIHISEESANTHSERSVWESTIATFIAKFIVALTFIIPLLFLELTTAIYVSVAWGFLVIGVLSYMMAKASKSEPLGVISEHLLITLVVIILTHLMGDFIGTHFAA
jgi:VIT1/CCC1 family predicted Fe2+/Mn2+ transporter